MLAATDPARRLDTVAAEVGWLLRQAGGYLQARGRTHAARALLDDADGFDAGGRQDGDDYASRATERLRQEVGCSSFTCTVTSPG